MLGFSIDPRESPRPPRTKGWGRYHPSPLPPRQEEAWLARSQKERKTPLARLRRGPGPSASSGSGTGRAALPGSGANPPTWQPRRQAALARHPEAEGGEGGSSAGDKADGGARHRRDPERGLRGEAPRSRPRTRRRGRCDWAGGPASDPLSCPPPPSCLLPCFLAEEGAEHGE
ncbi:lysosomal enzyme trafficking factor isoform 1-T1 [Liasis olivaceus]